MATRRQALTSAVARSGEVLAHPENDVSYEAAIQRFEFGFELAWRAVQERARYEGMDSSLPELSSFHLNYVAVRPVIDYLATTGRQC